MPRQQLPPNIKKITLPSGGIRYEVIIDTGVVAGKRKQSRKRFRTEEEARRELGKVVFQRDSGTYVHKRKTTVADAVDSWLSGRTSWQLSTLTGHRNRLKPLLTLYSELPLQDLTKTNIDELMARLEAGDLPRDGKQKRRPSNGQSRRNILSSIRQLLDSEVEQGHIPRNVAQYVDTPRLDSKERPTLTVQELRAVLDVTKDDRDGHQHQLGSLGLRKQELAGLCWEHIDMEAHTMRIVRTRTIVDGKVIIGQPKTDRSKRDLPIPDPVYSSLLHARAVQRQEMSQARDRYRDSGHVFVNELGDPVYPDYLTDRWKAACARAGVPVINLHDERHTCATLMILNGVPIPTVSAWLGHATSAFTMARYVHNQPHALAAAAVSYGALVTKRDENQVSMRPDLGK
ncbi:tyrosine-type recombinase/integrase [Rhodococcus sp. IEGM 1374]|uniref:tyrosine-type recombinase/integrase n=1 Tax=Rhodococcus sp. IEGM 1374 TaxID=3082221 RepID=UPI002955C188|nr:tyrosine-type recombinase/integrase [Rhodococcus sp. IEGM 1374]MDV7992177.1 tyrosine-type recombinase/integrase [Rhodococcus sp. IEGM 1374]